MASTGDLCTDGTNAVVHKPTGSLAQTKAVVFTQLVTVVTVLYTSKSLWLEKSFLICCL